MKQAIAGVAPPNTEEEVTVMTVWPSIAAGGMGRLIGRCCGSQIGFGKFFTLGKLFALLSIPFALALFFLGLMPFICQRYKLTNKRIAVLKGLTGVEDESVGLEKFDEIDVEVLPGQEWYPAGDLIFRHGNAEVLRLAGVSRPEGFRRVCLKTRQAYVAVMESLGGEAG